MKNYAQIELFIVEFIKKITGDEEIKTDMSFMDYGMDSMTIAALAGEITDEFGIVVDPVLLYEHPTIQSVCEALSTENAM